MPQHTLSRGLDYLVAAARPRLAVTRRDHAGIRSEALVSEEGVPFCGFPVIFDFC